MTNSYKKYLFVLAAIILLNGTVDAMKRKHEENGDSLGEPSCKIRRIDSEEEFFEEPSFDSYDSKMVYKPSIEELESAEDSDFPFLSTDEESEESYSYATEEYEGD